MNKALKILFVIILFWTFSVTTFALDVVIDLQEEDGEMALNEELRKLDVERKGNDTDIVSNSTDITTNTASIAANTASIAATQSIKAWVTFDGAGANGAKTPQDSYNVTGVSKTSTGIYVITWDTNFDGTTYCVVANTSQTAGQVAITTRATGTCTITATQDGAEVKDAVITLMAIGDQ